VSETKRSGEIPDHILSIWGCYKVFLDSEKKKDKLPGSDKDKDKRDKDKGAGMFTGVKNIV